MNKIIICGRLTRDPDIRQAGETTVCRYSLAVDRRFKKEGEPDADFFNCTAFGKAAEFGEKYLKRGTKLIVTGRMQSDNYTNKDGQKVYAWQVIVEEQEFAESKAAAVQNTEQTAPAESSDGFVPVADDDLPFM